MSSHLHPTFEGCVLLPLFEGFLNGRGCIVERRENDWTLSFGEGCCIAVAAPWRIIQDGRIAYAVDDDRQRFGLPQPIDGQSRANELLSTRRVTSARVDRVTADLCVEFDGGTRLDLFNSSCGYEGWQANFRIGGDEILIVGLGGGDVATYRPSADTVQNS